MKMAAIALVVAALGLAAPAAAGPDMIEVRTFDCSAFEQSWYDACRGYEEVTDPLLHVTAGLSLTDMAMRAEHLADLALRLTAESTEERALAEAVEDYAGHLRIVVGQSPQAEATSPASFPAGAP